MKKKLIIAAAIAFAVFAVPFGSSALSTVSVASENNTVAPTPAPVVDVDKVKVSIDNISITDVSWRLSNQDAGYSILPLP